MEGQDEAGPLLSRRISRQLGPEPKFQRIGGCPLPNSFDRKPYEAKAARGFSLRTCAEGDAALTDLVLLQLTDLFRIGLVIALVVTMRRTAAVTGRVLPLALGVVFVAVILPTTMPSSSASVIDAVLAGLISNSIILIPVLVVAELIARLRR